MKTLRCAIYTRKSSEEGLEQGFNSLDAQREACAAYVTSQTGEGWRLVREHYDDGGFSGGTMERPALRRLLADIDAGKIDVVVVYKVDRLTRALADFSRIIERLEAADACFVSVTQAFNTTTSMGRLTLNVLLSFAQFEREVTGERIRDKIAASKARGLWMGGYPMLGYTPKGRTLEIEPTEADTVRHIFQRYVELGSVHPLQAELEAVGVRSKQWITHKGRTMGGGVMGRGALYHLLRNRIYVGEITHKGRVYAGQHPPIVERDLFDAVQAGINRATQDRGVHPLRAGASPLRGLVYDDRDNIMSPTHARGKTKRPHRYYVARPLLTGRKAEAGSLPRVSAAALEELVLDRLRKIAVSELDWPMARTQIVKVRVAIDSIEISLSAGAERIEERLPPSDEVRLYGGACVIRVPIRLGARGSAFRLLDPYGRAVVDRVQPNDVFISALARAWRWRARLLSGDVANAADLARSEGLTGTRVLERLRLAYLAPDLIRDILDGRQWPGLTLDQLCRADTPFDWAAQRRLFG